MEQDPYKERLYAMRLTDIYNRYSGLSYDLPLQDFIQLFPVVHKRGRPVLPDKPIGYDLDKQIFLEVLLAFRQSFS